MLGSGFESVAATTATDAIRPNPTTATRTCTTSTGVLETAHDATPNPCAKPTTSVTCDRRSTASSRKPQPIGTTWSNFQPAVLLEALGSSRPAISSNEAAAQSSTRGCLPARCPPSHRGRARDA